MAAAKKEEKKPVMSCASSGHITKLKQSIFALRYLWKQLTELVERIKNKTIGLAQLEQNLPTNNEHWKVIKFV